MTKKEYMKKLAYQLRRLPKEDFDKAMDYFEEYFEDAGIENEQKAIEDLGAPEEAASALILDLAQENAVKPPKTMKRRFSALWIAILALFAAPIALPLALGILAVIGAVILGILRSMCHMDQICIHQFVWKQVKKFSCRMKDGHLRVKRMAYLFT